MEPHVPWYTRFGRWLATPIREGRRLFPFTHEGRQTLIYLVFAGAGPALTMLAIDIMHDAMGAKQWAVYSAMAAKIGWALLIITSGLACFVSIRAIKLGKDGFAVDGRDPQQPPPPTTVTTTTETVVKPGGDGPQNLG
jgi:hypothetical protein